MPVSVYSDSIPEFAGFIETCDIEKRGKVWYHSIRCIDNHYLATKRVIAETYKNVQAGDVLTDIFSKYLAAEGVKGTRAQPTFTRASSGYHKDSVQESANVPIFDPAGGTIGVLIAEGGLYLNYSMVNSGGNCYHYVDMTSVTDYVIQAGDYLEYDVFWFTDAPAVKSIAFDYTTSDGATLRGSASDQNGLGSQPSTDLAAVASGKWYHRKIQLPGSHVGKTIQYYDLACEYDLGGTVEALIKNIQVTNGAGTVRKNIWACGDALPSLAVHLTTSGSQTLSATVVSGETLTIPASGVLNTSEGCIEFLLYVNDALKDGSCDRYVFAHAPGGNPSNTFAFRHKTTGGFSFILRDAAAGTTEVGIPELTNGLHRLALRWNSTEAAAFADGTKYSVSSPRLPTTLTSTFNLGTWPSATGSTGWINTSVSDFLVSNRWRSDEELAVRSVLTPLTPDPATTYYLPLTSTLTAMTTIDAGATVLEKRFRYITCSNAIDSLAEGSGYTWFIDPARWLHFKPKDAYPAPWTITSQDILKNTETFGREAPEYRNRQYILGVKQLTSLQTEYKKGDGNETSWTVGYPIALAPSVWVNNVVKTVGIKGFDSGRDFYWSKGESTITQDTSGTVLTASDILKIQYQGMFDIVLMGENTAGIQERKGVEGGTGYVDDVMSATQTTDPVASLEIANSKLQKYGVVSRRFRFSTARSGLEPGQVAQVNVPEHALTGDMLVEKVDSKDNGNGGLIYDISIVDGPVVGSWAKSMASMGDNQTISDDANDSESVMILVADTKTMSVSGSVTVTINACPLPDPLTFPGDTQYPC